MRHVQILGTLRVKHMESSDLTRFNMYVMHVQKATPAQPARSPSHPPGESLGDYEEDSLPWEGDTAFGSCERRMVPEASLRRGCARNTVTPRAL